MKVMKNGIFKSIDGKDWDYYRERGWKKAGCPEPQPSQFNLYVINDYTIGRLDNIHNSNQI